MVSLYTRTGDEGTTALFGGQRVSKDDARLEAYGTLDELNSVLGVLRLHASEASGARERLLVVQQDLFVLGAVMATPSEQLPRLGARMAQPTWEIAAMEAKGLDPYADRVTDTPDEGAPKAAAPAAAADVAPVQADDQQPEAPKVADVPPTAAQDVQPVASTAPQTYRADMR